MTINRKPKLAMRFHIHFKEINHLPDYKFNFHHSRSPFPSKKVRKIITPGLISDNSKNQSCSSQRGNLKNHKIIGISYFKKFYMSFIQKLFTSTLHRRALPYRSGTSLTITKKKKSGPNITIISPK